MSRHEACIRWERTSETFGYEDFNREHEWRFPGGTSIAASAAPDYSGDERCVDPEEALVAAIASCHMLTFLAICARKRLTVNRYTDEAVGRLETNDQGRLAVTRVELSPRIEFEEQQPDPDVIARLHESAHRACFIANSVKTEIVVNPAG
ncbi:MAG: OsmC family protein [Xanthomonadales bacterium]|nr:OsmC family protein [Xanthomonadales bacterium]